MRPDPAETLDPSYADFVDAFKRENEVIQANLFSSLVIAGACLVAVLCLSVAIALFLSSAP